MYYFRVMVTDCKVLKLCIDAKIGCIVPTIQINVRSENTKDRAKHILDILQVEKRRRDKTTMRIQNSIPCKFTSGAPPHANQNGQGTSAPSNAGLQILQCMHTVFNNMVNLTGG